VRAQVQQILENYEISSAAYHGGDLNGVSTRRLMKHAADIFRDIENYLLSYQHDERCSDAYIMDVCSTYTSIYSSLDAITSMLRIKSGEAMEEHYELLDKSLITLQNSWEAAFLNHTPKFHSLISHASPQMKQLGGIGDILEDDVEKMHQIASRSESRVSRLKSVNSRAMAEAKIEAMSQNNLVKRRIAESQHLSKRRHVDETLKKTTADEKKKNLKSVRIEKRIEIITELEQKPAPKVIPAYERLKMLLSDDIKKEK
jgi:hypothetical protein